MAELITRDALEDMLEDLRLSFRVRIPEKDVEGTIRNWLDALTGLTAESVRTAAKRCIQTGEHFPRVKEVRELALDFMARTSGTFIAHQPTNGDTCGICGARYEYHEVRRKQVRVEKNELGRDRHVEVLDKKGQPVWETVTSPRQEIYHDRAAHKLAEALP